jgi:hypothetical protein
VIPNGLFYLHHSTKLQADATSRFFFGDPCLHQIGNTFIEMKLKLFLEFIVAHKTL